MPGPADASDEPSDTGPGTDEAPGPDAASDAETGQSGSDACAGPDAGLDCSASGPAFAIHDGEPHPPPCAEVLTRTDAVFPRTVDTASRGAPQKVGPPVNDSCPDGSEISADGQTLSTT